MGLSTVATFALFALALISIVLVSYAIINESAKTTVEAIREEHNLFRLRQATSIKINNISVSGICTNYNLTISATNMGSIALDRAKMNILDNGVLINNTMRGAWAPGSDIYLNYTEMSTMASNHTIKIVTENGVSAIGKYNLTDCEI
ncbi:MAG: hypothetical protein QXP42_00940 [Candidatus Micrarchaeia archaeon]